MFTFFTILKGKLAKKLLPLLSLLVNCAKLADGVTLVNAITSHDKFEYNLYGKMSFPSRERRKINTRSIKTLQEK